MAIIDCGCNNFPAGLGNVTFGANVGIGVTPAAWDSAFRGLQIGGTGTISAHSAAAAAGHVFNIMQNAYYGLGGSPPSVDFHYLAADKASRLMLAGGELSIFTAPAGADPIPWTERVRVVNDGKVGINTTNPSEKLEVNGNVKVAGKGTFGGETTQGLAIGNGRIFAFADQGNPSRLDIANGVVQIIGDAPDINGGVYIRIKSAAEGGQGAFRVRNMGNTADVLRVTAAGEVYVNEVKAINGQGQCLYG